MAQGLNCLVRHFKRRLKVWRFCSDFPHPAESWRCFPGRNVGNLWFPGQFLCSLRSFSVCRWTAGTPHCDAARQSALDGGAIEGHQKILFHNDIRKDSFCRACRTTSVALRCSCWHQHHLCDRSLGSPGVVLQVVMATPLCQLLDLLPACRLVSLTSPTTVVLSVNLMTVLVGRMEVQSWVRNASWGG